MSKSSDALALRDKEIEALKPSDFYCPVCHKFAWKNIDGEEGWMTWICTKCWKWKVRIVWSEA